MDILKAVAILVVMAVLPSCSLYTVDRTFDDGSKIDATVASMFVEASEPRFTYQTGDEGIRVELSANSKEIDAAAIEAVISGLIKAGYMIVNPAGGVMGAVKDD